ncbi:MAG: asparagine--tRNA ligase [Gammaproteobacteria bacterium]|jgi:asparaginyl-tRNA synthetase
MTQKLRILDLLNADYSMPAISIDGWVRTRRDSKDFSFIELNDGSCLANIQVIADTGITGYEHIHEFSTGSAISVKGELIESPGKGQRWEIKALEISILGSAPDDFPLQKKRHTDEFLRSIAHLRPRTNKYGAMFRIRSRISMAVHKFFEEKGFVWIHTPIITGSDCEGAGNMFHVTTLDFANIPKENGQVNYSEDFFGKQANLTVSGQLSLEAYCLSLGKVYSFGPTFRSENSNTSRHISEFWMIEPEVAFADIEDNMQLGEELIQYLVNYVLNHCLDDIELFTKFIDKTLLSRLENIEKTEFIRLTYREAINILEKSSQTFEYEPLWGKDLQSEHERYLTEHHFKQPVIVKDYPKQIKAFYMRQNDDEETVAAMDILVPQIGEIIGGSQREERYDKLVSRLNEMNLNAEDYWWYLDTRKYGSVIHSGFGLGLERFLMLVTGVTNIRDVIPYPRTPKHLEF